MMDDAPRQILRPLGFLAMWFLPIFLLVRRGERRLYLERRAKYTRELRDYNQSRKLVKRELDKETNEFWQIIESVYVRMGHVYLPRQDHQSAAGAKKNKAQKVRVECAFVSLDAPEIIYYKLLTVHRGRLRTSNALPYYTFVGDLVSEDRLRELSWACRRVVTAVYEDPRFGVWLRVHRMEGVGGLPSKVEFRHMLANYPEDMSTGTLILGLGGHRTVHSVTIEEHPHLLIAGSTRSGKSNILNNLISAMMIFTSPTELKFILIDLKRMEFKLYRKSGHLYCPVVTEADLALQTLQDLADEIVRRSREIEPSECKTLAEWNMEYPDRAFPRLICVIDEHAELMLASGRKVAKEVAALIDRISNLGRAVGVHLWVCTQHPSVDVLGNSAKTNFPCIIAGRTQNKTQSNVILGNGDAAFLPIVPGRMLYQSGPNQQAIQTPYIDKDDIRQAVRISRGRAAGLITVEGVEPVIIYEQLVKFVADHGGKLNASLVDECLKEYAITAKMFKAFVSEIIQLDRIEVLGNIYSVVKKGKSYHLVVEAQPVVEEPEMQEQPAAAEPVPFTFDMEPSYLRLLAAPQATVETEEPVQPEPIEETVEQVQPEAYKSPVQAPPIEQSPDEIIDAFVIARCTLGKRLTALAEDLYAALEQYCNVEDYSVPSKRSLGIALKQRGFRSVRVGTDGSRAWKGIELNDISSDTTDKKAMPDISDETQEQPTEAVAA